MTATNPFFDISLLPYQAPHFDEINDSHYRPAFDEALRQKRADVDTIVSQTAAPDFTNTVLALEKSGAMLSRVSSVFFAMTSAHTNAYLQELEEQFSTELAALANDIWLNDTLFARVESVWQDRAALDAESRRLVEETYQRFILAGARLNETEKAELKALNTEAATLTSQFNQRLLAADKTGGLVVDYAHQLDGLSASEIADASERRTERMVNPALSNGLTAFLTTQAGVNSGFMIVQYAAASMVSENKVYAHPASVDSIPSSANQEDIVSMGTTAARKAKMILQNTQDVLADELLTACQAIDIRRRLNTHGQGLTPLHEAIYQHVRKEVAFYEVDREIWPDIRAVEKMIRSGELLDIVKEYIPDFE